MLNVEIAELSAISEISSKYVDSDTLSSNADVVKIGVLFQNADGIRDRLNTPCAGVFGKRRNENVCVANNNRI